MLYRVATGLSKPSSPSTGLFTYTAHFTAIYNTMREDEWKFSSMKQQIYNHFGNGNVNTEHSPELGNWAM